MTTQFKHFLIILFLSLNIFAQNDSTSDTAVIPPEKVEKSTNKKDEPKEDKEEVKKDDKKVDNVFLAKIDATSNKKIRLMKLKYIK